MIAAVQSSLHSNALNSSMMEDDTPIDSNTMSIALRSLDRMLKMHMLSLQDLMSDNPGSLQLPRRPSLGTAKVDRRFSQLFGGSNAKEAEAAVTKTPAIRTEQTPVWIRVMFKKIGAIDTIHDRFQADVMIHSTWREPSLDGKKADPESIAWDEYWTPKLSISNGMSDLKYEVDRKLDYDLNGRAMMHERRHTTGQFYELMELHHFPFDSQDLTVTVLSERDSTEVELVESEEPSAVNHDAFSAEQEWAMAEKVNVWKKMTTKKTETATYNYPNFCVAAKVMRRPQFFIWNIIVILLTICSLAFSTFTVKMETPESRLPLTFILVLTTVTFKFVVNKNLPRISYLTLMDKYILGCMIILSVICVWHSIAGAIVYATPSPSGVTAATTTTTTAASTPLINSSSSFVVISTTASAASTCPTYATRSSTSNGRMADRIAMGCLAFIYVMFHLVFLFIIFVVARRDKEGTNEEIFHELHEQISSHEEANIQPSDKTALNFHSVGTSVGAGRRAALRGNENTVAAQIAIGGD